MKKVGRESFKLTLPTHAWGRGPHPSTDDYTLHAFCTLAMPRIKPFGTAIGWMQGGQSSFG